MNDLPVTLVIGFATGFLGAIPPGPINVTVIRKSSLGQTREALRVALGGALIDTAICGLVGMGFGWILEKLTRNSWVKGTLALLLVAYGLKVLLVDRKREDEIRPLLPTSTPHLHLPERARLRFPFLMGLVQGAANPALIVNWTILISFLVGHGLLPADLLSAAAFALGVGLGVFSWFALLTELVQKLSDHPSGRWLRESATLAGVLLLLFGLVFSYQTIAAF